MTELTTAMLITEDVRAGRDPSIARELDTTLPIIAKQHVFTQRHDESPKESYQGIKRLVSQIIMNMKF